ncbi:MAG: TlpA family protein disulfide reductase [Planctomycetota bacterium]
MDCCSLEGRTLKQDVVVEVLPEFVLVRLEPLDWEEDREFAEKFGVRKFPALLLLDWQGKKKLGQLGDVSPEELAKGLRRALGR